MEYTPRFVQPFSLAEAINLDVTVITEEIARLQNSLMHLKETQRILQADLGESEEVDPEVVKAFEENKLVIDSQEERISILNMALIEKGIVFSSHYEITPQSLRSAGSSLNRPFTGPETREMTSSEETEENGVYL
ncbi:hypothetical protein BDN70DRAFT_796013 [Pholiota conissans]|uniref:Uncharacterized protein n=1 Tax=Pholiota conissans TaxID=109636 RepID=A0A9P6D725_9AGAR|nr:hypothetical protein BDN70DRAFT_796013 [Pholiota conissans]